MPERVFAFMGLSGLIWASMFFMYMSNTFFSPSQIHTSELIWIGGFLQIVVFLLCFMVPNLLSKMSVFLWINRGDTARKIEKMIYDPDFDMEDE